MMMIRKMKKKVEPNTNEKKEETISVEEKITEKKKDEL